MSANLKDRIDAAFESDHLRCYEAIIGCAPDGTEGRDNLFRPAWWNGAGSIKIPAGENKWVHNAGDPSGGDHYTLYALRFNLDCKTQFPEILRGVAECLGIDVPENTRRGKSERAKPPTTAEAEALAAEYGLTWADYERYGCKLTTFYFPSLQNREGVNPLQPAITYPVILHDGKTTRIKAKTLQRFPDKSGRMKRHSVHDKNRLTENWQGSEQGLFPAVLEQSNAVCWITGGEEKALLLRKLGYTAFIFGNDAGSLPIEIAALLLRYFQRFGLLFDQGEGDPVKCAEVIHASAFDSAKRIETQIGKWPKDRKKGHDLNDEFLEHGGADAVRTILESAEFWAPDKVIYIESTNRQQNVLTAIKCLARDERIFTRGNKVLVEYNRGKIDPLNVHVLPEKISGSCLWLKQLKDGTTVEHEIGDRLARNIFTRGDFPGIPEITGVVNFPILRADGSVHQTPGFDPVTGYWLNSADTWNVPDKPDINLILKPFAEFDFVNDNHRAAVVAMMLTILIRHIINGHVPIGAIDANLKGTGKTLVSQVIAVVTAGKREFETMILKQDEVELAKLLVSRLKSGATVLYFDNIDAPILSQTLCTLTTTGSFTERILGFNDDTGGIQWRPFTLFNGNNLAFRKDIVRRIITARMIKTVDGQRNRKYAVSLPGWAFDNRRAMVENLLAIVRQYILVGKPAINTKPLESFEEWRELVASAMVHAGLPDPNTNECVQAGVDDPQDQAFATLMEWLIKRSGSKFTTGDFWQHVNRNDHELKEAIIGLVNDGDRMPSVQKFGIALGRYWQHPHDGFFLDYEADRQRKKHWFAKPLPRVAESYTAPLRKNTISKPILQKSDIISEYAPNRDSEHSATLGTPPERVDTDADLCCTVCGSPDVRIGAPGGPFCSEQCEQTAADSATAEVAR